MNESSNKKRYCYIDNIKLFACVLVVTGHLFQAMVQNNLMSDTPLFWIFSQASYTFHVPLFFVCSGFLYQKTNRVHSLAAYKSNILKKLLDIGVPYFTFSALTVVLKTMFSNVVTLKTQGIITALFVNPDAPYWYLYSLFFMFLLIPCFNTKKGAYITVLICLVLKIVHSLLRMKIAIPFYPLASFMDNSIWFSIGIFFAFTDLDNIKAYSKISSVIMLALAFLLSVFYYNKLFYNPPLKAFIGFMFVVSIFIVSVWIQPNWLNKISRRFSEYFMPVFLMHTIVSAPIRIILLKLSIQNIYVQIVFGLSASFIIPIIIFLICKKLTPLMFFIYPTKTIKIMRAKYEKTKTNAD